jgi:P27 family predicted phage terminase small subunit
MGRRGPAPLPTHLKIVRGTARPDRMVKNEPKAKSGIPRCPDWLSDDAKEIWKRTVKQLKQMGTLSVADVDLIAAYCNAVVTYKKATDLVDKSGVLIKGRRDGVVTNPAVRIQRDAAQLIRQLGAEFGLSPSSRSRISVDGASDDSDDFLD